MSTRRWLKRTFRVPARNALSAPSPLTRERISAFLTERDYHFNIDDDGDATGTWDDHRFWFLLFGDKQEIVQTRGRWARTLPLEARHNALLVINDWNRDRIWPKTYLREEESQIAIYAEVSADLEPGSNDDQLAQILSCGLGTAIQFFRNLDSRFPDEDAVTDEEIPDN